VRAPRVVVAGGHSAGHVEPAMNLADALRRLEPTAEITALGTVRGLDTTLIPARGYQLELIPPAPLPRTLNRALLQAPGRLRDSVRAAGAVLDRARAEIVVGFGGYVADAGLPRRPQAGRADRRPRGERPARSGKPAGGPDDAPRVHRRAECPAASRHRHRDPAAAGDHSTGSRCATQPGSGSGCVRAGRSFWSPGARRAPGRSTPRCPARPRRCGRPACRCCTSPGRSTWSRCRTAATPTRPTSPSPTSGKCSTPTLRPTS